MNLIERAIIRAHVQKGRCDRCDSSYIFFDVCHTATCIQHTDNVISQAQADRRGECAAGLRTLKDCKGTGADPILLLALSTSPAVC